MVRTLFLFQVSCQSISDGEPIESQGERLKKKEELLG
jgi:hypothetical protein